MVLVGVIESIYFEHRVCMLRGSHFVNIVVHCFVMLPGSCFVLTKPTFGGVLKFGILTLLALSVT